MRGSRREAGRGFFSTDVGTAVLLVLVATFIGVLSLKTTANALAWDSGLGSSESAALRLADFLLKECAGPGLSECDSSFAYSHILSASKVRALSGENALKKIVGVEKNVSARVLGTNGEVIAGAGKTAGVCVKRIALLDEKEVFLEVCSE